MNRQMIRDKRNRWSRYIRRAEQQVIALLDYRRWNSIFETVVNSNPNLDAGNAILQYFRRIYGDYATMAIRRLAKPHDDAFSLLELVDDIATNPGLIRLDDMIEGYKEPHPDGTRYDDEMAARLARSTLAPYADQSGDVFDPAVAQADAQRLRDATEKIIAFADGAVAHDDRNPPEAITFNDINKAIDVIEEIARKYILLLTGYSFLRLTPYDQTNAVRVFRAPWIDPAHEPDFPEGLF